MRRCFFRAALSHNRTLAANCRKLVSTRTSWVIKAKAIASVFATRAARIGFAARPESLRRVFAASQWFWMRIPWHEWPAGNFNSPETLPLVAQLGQGLFAVRHTLNHGTRRPPAQP